MADISFILGVVGNVISLLVFISPAKTFWRIVKNKSTQDFRSLPYICTLLSTSLWTYYGLIKPGGLLVATVNGAGAVLEAIYVIMFIIYVDKEIRLKTIMVVLLVDVASFVVVFLVTFLALDHHIRITVIGVLCVILTLSMYGSPLAAMRTVILKKSVEFMPFWLSFFLFINGGIWAVWAVLEGDVFVGIPNGIGFGLGATQLVVYMIYRKGKPGKDEDVKAEGFKRAGDIEMGAGDGDEDEFTTAADSKYRRNTIEKGLNAPKAANLHGLRKFAKSFSLDSGSRSHRQMEAATSIVPRREGENQEVE